MENSAKMYIAGFNDYDKTSGNTESKYDKLVGGYNKASRPMARPVARAVPSATPVVTETSATASVQTASTATNADKTCPTCPKPQSLSNTGVSTYSTQSSSEQPFMRYRGGMFGRMEDTIVEYLRMNNTVKRDSCIECVKKHVGYAKRLIEESKTLSADVKGSVLLNHLDTIGELRCATDEATEYPELYNVLLASERAYRYEGITPDWDTIAELMLQYGATVPNA